MWLGMLMSRSPESAWNSTTSFRDKSKVEVCGVPIFWSMAPLLCVGTAAPKATVISKQIIRKSCGAASQMSNNERSFRWSQLNMRNPDAESLQTGTWIRNSLRTELANLVTEMSGMKNQQCNAKELLRSQGHRIRAFLRDCRGISPTCELYTGHQKDPGVILATTQQQQLRDPSPICYRYSSAIIN
ncbi:hypothetical protein SCHPADRAFT_890911 [Schizopora paradoxa]|uniref:Uncharacterized protein n=1 Tax=Schizopora paradoxa TaxID=27342 RepID=A0A0H2RK12_9AGAM|nr:hypothetical protein SCHPADRAFT_890911 [Schizopora paradoxa]